MKIAFALFKYFPFGGLQKDMLAIAGACQDKGHELTIFCNEWQGEKPENLSLQILPVKARSNHKKNHLFIEAFLQALEKGDFDCVVGFNKMPGLDFYYAADTCFKTKLEKERPWFYRLLPRYRLFVDQEAAVFAPSAKTHILAIAERSIAEYQACYGTPRERFTLLPPGISPDRKKSADSIQRRRKMRALLKLADNDFALLFIGSGFRTKGLDRALLAMAALPEEIRHRTQFFIVGQDKKPAFEALAKQAGILSRVHFMGGRKDVPDFLVAADLLVHPAYRENTGTVLLEAAIAGLPVITTAVCGYAHYIEEFNCGVVLNEPYEQQAMDKALLQALQGKQRNTWQQNGLRLSETADIYSLASTAANIICQNAEHQHD
ncbi:MAG: glycosyltransferase family 4 protein [Pseudomonadales bacterium]|nr:glycosyltransferase family 4 protein [Pseudomonadales bacterium]